MEMQYSQLFDGEAQKYFSVQHNLGQENLGDFHTKAFTTKDAQHAQPFQVHEKTTPQQLVCTLMPSTWRGCVGKTQEFYLCGRLSTILSVYNDQVTVPVA